MTSNGIGAVPDQRILGETNITDILEIVTDNYFEIRNST